MEELHQVDALAADQCRGMYICVLGVCGCLGVCVCMGMYVCMGMCIYILCVYVYICIV